jgi:hypothetical protein
LLIRKYHLQKIDGKDSPRPSATFIMINFKDSAAASDWFAVNSKNKYDVLTHFKPKSIYWLDNNKVYFIQTYHTPQWDYIDLLKTAFIENLNMQNKNQN